MEAPGVKQAQHQRQDLFANVAPPSFFFFSPPPPSRPKVVRREDMVSLVTLEARGATLSACRTRGLRRSRFFLVYRRAPRYEIWHRCFWTNERHPKDTKIRKT